MEVSIVMRSEVNQVKITRVGIDLGKSAFHVHAVDRAGKVVMEKRFTGLALVRFLGELEPCVVGLGACGGAHHWARVLRGLGHDARLMSPQFVKPYVKSNKNDCTRFACRSPSYNFVMHWLMSSRRSTASWVIAHLRIGSKAVS